MSSPANGLFQQADNTCMTLLPLTNEEADRLDGTLPGILADSAAKLVKPARRIGVGLASAGVMVFVMAEILNAASLEPSQVDARIVSGCVLAIAISIVFLVFGYGVGRMDAKKRRPGRRVRYSAGRKYLETTRTSVGVGPVIGGSNPGGVATTVSSVSMSDPNWTVVSVTAWRKNDGYSWSANSKTVSSFEPENVEAAYQEAISLAEQWDLLERQRLAGLYS